MQYYHDIITEKSFIFLTELAKKFDFALIGGWAVFTYTRALKSKDIDLIIDYAELGKMREEYAVVKNDRLKKYEIKTGEFDVDIYLPHYSALGIPAEAVIENAVIKEGFRVPPLEMLFLLKLYAWREREGTSKGEKDKIDIFSMALLPEFDWKNYRKLMHTFHLGALHEKFIQLLKRTAAVPELAVNHNAMAKHKKHILSSLSEKTGLK